MTTEPEELRLAAALGHVCAARANLVHALEFIGDVDGQRRTCADIANAQTLLADAQLAIQAQIRQACRKGEET